jgi:hypothetical protein
MYAGTTFRKRSGSFVGVHQKIDRIARNQLVNFIGKKEYFPGIQSILHFEGNNGPDGIKRKSPFVDEPWHHINPSDPSDREIFTIIKDHIFNLSKSLAENNNVRAAFEAAWLAHAVTDGLTPAHHFPLDEKIGELWGDSNGRTSIKDKGLIKGDNARDTVSKNWEYWGAGGVMNKHLSFEMGVATAIASENYKYDFMSYEDVIRLNKHGFEKIYMESINKVYALKIYDEYLESGWTTQMASKVKTELIPEIIRMVTLAWLDAVQKTYRGGKL